MVEKIEIRTLLFAYYFKCDIIQIVNYCDNHTTIIRKIKL